MFGNAPKAAKKPNAFSWKKIPAGKVPSWKMPNPDPSYRKWGKMGHSK
jgi:hypothetical protein